MEMNMFCYQCQETAKGVGCMLKGVCGKESHTAQAMDLLLLFVVRGVSVVTDALRKAGCPVPGEADVFVVDALFSTITNANFDDESILQRVDKGLALRNRLMDEAKRNNVFLPEVDELSWQGTRADYAEKAKSVGVLREPDEDLRSLKELLTYGLKGMAAYLEHAMRLGFNDNDIHVFMQHALATIPAARFGGRMDAVGARSRRFRGKDHGAAGRGEYGNLWKSRNHQSEYRCQEPSGHPD